MAHPPNMTDSDTSRLSDGDLVRRAGAGDVGAFRALFERHQRWVANVAYRFCGSRDDALDVLQETFTYLHRKLPSLELVGKMTTFLYPVVKHRAFDLLRRRKRQARVSGGPEPLDSVAAPAEEPSGRDAEVREFLHGLPELQREVLVLRFIDELSYAEISDLLEVPIGTVKSRLHNALRLARQVMGDAFAEA